MSTIVERFLAYLNIERGLSQNTIENYGHDLRQIEALLPDGLVKASRDELRRLFLDLSAGGMNPSSVRRKISTLRHFHHYCRRKRMVVGDPLRGIPLPRRGLRLPQPISTGDFDKLLMAAAGNATPAGLCEYAILRLSDSCGLRVSELVKLTLEDLHLDEGHLIVHGGKGDKDRFVPIDEAGIKALTEYLQRAQPVLYPGQTRLFPLSRQRIWQIFQHCLRIPQARLSKFQTCISR
jgi:integrase/recombinase XerD